VTSILIVNFAISAGLFALLWAMSVRIKDPSFIDAWWALGIVVLAWATFLQTPSPGPHALALVALATAWGLRLGLHLLRRWRDHGKDRRYAGLEATARDKHGLSFAAFSALWVFGPQMALQFAVALPAMLGQIAERETFGWLAWCGLALSVFGIAYEAIADWQLARFKADPANASKVMDRGLWRYSRHPNYFGDMCAWWGMYAIAADAGHALWALPGPALLTFLLTRVSGAPTTEPHLKLTRPEYEAYKARTSAFVPWAPKRSATGSQAPS
jgi:steroid 5-alpha reductase family enzyme